MPALNPRPRVLVVDDDRAVLRSITAALRAHHYRVMEASTAGEGQRLALTEQPDLLILDVGLPDMTGTELCHELRRLHFAAPILMVTGMRDVEDRVRGLEAGADDYLPKPFDERELVARVAALLRRSQRLGEQPRVLVCDGVRVDFSLATATRDGEPLRLTKTEFALLKLLARNRGRTVSRKTILDMVWGYTRTPDTRTVDTHIWRLRKKFGDRGDDPRWLILVPGQGYRLENCAIDPERSEI